MRARLAVLAALLDSLGRPRCVRGARVFRVLVALTSLFQLCLLYPVHMRLFGPEGPYPYALFRAHASPWSLLALAQSRELTEMVFHAAIAASIGLLLGMGPRCMALLLWLFRVTLYERSPYLWDGGDNFLQIILLFAVGLQMERPRAPRGPSRAWALGLLHNGALLAIALQLCTVYAVAGLTKVQGAAWRDGTALYYALASREYGLSPLGQWVTQWTPAVVLLTYATVFFQVGFPFLFFLSRGTRRLALVLGIAFHAGIAVCMNLVSFAAFFVAAELLFLGDDLAALPIVQRRPS